MQSEWRTNYPQPNYPLSVGIVIAYYGTRGSRVAAHHIVPTLMAVPLFHTCFVWTWLRSTPGTPQAAPSSGLVHTWAQQAQQRAVESGPATAARSKGCCCLGLQFPVVAAPRRDVAWNAILAPRQLLLVPWAPPLQRGAPSTAARPNLQMPACRRRAAALPWAPLLLFCAASAAVAGDPGFVPSRRTSCTLHPDLHQA